MNNFSKLLAISIFMANAASFAEQKPSAPIDEKNIKNCILHRRKDGSLTYRVYTEKQFSDGKKYSDRENRTTIPDGWQLEKESALDVAWRLAKDSKWTIALVGSIIGGVAGCEFTRDEKYQKAVFALTFLTAFALAPHAIKEVPHLYSDASELIKEGKRYNVVKKN